MSTLAKSERNALRVVINNAINTAINTATDTIPNSNHGQTNSLLIGDSDDPPNIGEYDCIVVDEAHRGYTLDQDMDDEEIVLRDQLDYQSKYRMVLDHFDAYKIGLTATPALHTKEIFGEPIFNYSYRRAVVEGHLIDFEPPYVFQTKLSKEGINWNKGD